MTMAPMEPGPARMALFIESEDPVRLRHLAVLVTSAVLLDWPVTVIWMGRALRTLAEGRLDLGPAGRGETPAGEPAEGHPAALLAEARQLGRVTYLACSADSRALGRPREELLLRLDDILAMTTILRRIRGAETTLYL